MGARSKSPASGRGRPPCGAAIHRLELPQGRFERRVALPPGRYDSVRRTIVNGCLFITLRKGGRALLIRPFDFLQSPASDASGGRSKARRQRAARRDDHRAGSQYRAVSRASCSPSVWAGRARSPPRSKRCARQRQVGILMQRDARPEEPRPSTSTASARLPIMRALRHRAGRQRTTSSARATSASASRSFVKEQPFLAAQRCPDSRARAHSRRNRGALPPSAAAKRSKRLQLLPQVAAGIARRRAVDARRRRARRSRRGLHGREAGGEAGNSRDDRRRGADGQGLAPARAAHRSAAAVAGNRAARPRRRSTSGSARYCCASRWRRSSVSSAKARRQGQEMAELERGDRQGAECRTEVEEQARKELRRLERMPEAAAEARHGAHLSRLARRTALAAAAKRGRSTSPRRAGSSTRTTSVSTRSSTGSSNTLPCVSSRRTARRRSCAWSGRRASARPRSANRSPAPWVARSCASASAASTTRPRFADIGAPISARYPATSSRPSARRALAIA